MKQSFKQIRYFGENSTQNSANISGASLIRGDFFTEGTLITQLGIRALPGTKFYINNNSNPVIIGHLGLFELDFSNSGSISSLKFDPQSIGIIDEPKKGGYLIIDMLIRGGE